MKNFDFKAKKWLILIVASALFLRLFLALNYEGTGDTGAWRLVAKTGIENKDFGYGKNPYDGTCKTSCVNVPPLTFHYYTLMGKIYSDFNFLKLPDWGFYKLPSVLGDVGIIIILYYMARVLKLKNPLKIASIYAFHPVPLYVAGYHGQRDSIWLFFVLLAIIFFLKKRFFLSALFFGFGISFKIPPLFLLPFFFLKIPKLKDKLLFAGTVPAVFFILNLPEIFTHFKNVFRLVFLYKGWSGWWGLSGMITKISNYTQNPNLIKFFDPLSRILLYGAIGLSSIFFVRKRVNFIPAVLGMTMVVFVFSPIFASQYLIWPLPFIVLLADKYPKYFKLYSLLAIFVAINFYGIFGILPLEKIFLTFLQHSLYYKLKFISYPVDLAFPLWVFSVFFAKKLAHVKMAKKR